MAGDVEFDRMLNSVDDFSMEAALGLEASTPGHQCQVCLKTFVSSKGLQQHSIVHTNRKPFVCEVCQKSFRFKSNLFEHRSIHTGEHPYVCPFCSKTCRLKGNLKKHLKTHIKEADEIDRAYEAVTGNVSASTGTYRTESGEDGSYDSPYAMFTKQNRRKVISPRKISKAPTVGLVVTVGQNDDVEPYSEGPLNHPQLKDMTNIDCTLTSFLNIARYITFDKCNCRLCRITFYSLADIKDHAVTMHGMGKAKEDDKGDGTKWCEKCVLAFDDQKELDKHMNYHSEFEKMVETGDFRLREPNPLAHH
uniref:C2H2-type domain-containing protein n=1 Tax=Trichuris muris TaxID=70415 RepID=A0A5S6QWQ8_TRIMR